MDKNQTCCFLGHRKIDGTEELRQKIYEIIERLITKDDIDTFLFGSKSEFNLLCYELVTKIKIKHPHIKRVFVRAEYPNIDEDYKAYLLQKYDDTYFPEHIKNAGKAVYIKRNVEMIDKSSACVFYYNSNYTPPCRKPSKRRIAYCKPESGTKIAYDYAIKKKRKIINIANSTTLAF